MAAEQVVTTQTRQIPLRSPYATVNQPVKKGGAGGAFTWGGVADVQDFGLIGGQRAPTVTTLPATNFTSSLTIPVGSANMSTGTTTMVSSPTSAGTPMNVTSLAQFPPIGVGSQPAPVTWGPPIANRTYGQTVSAQPIVAPATYTTQSAAVSAQPIVAPVTYTTQAAAVSAQPITYTTQPAGSPGGWTVVNPQSQVVTTNSGLITAPAQAGTVPAQASAKKKDTCLEESKEDKKVEPEEKKGDCSIQ